jgi:hypothetical protein
MYKEMTGWIGSWIIVCQLLVKKLLKPDKSAIVTQERVHNSKSA